MAEVLAVAKQLGIARTPDEAAAFRDRIEARLDAPSGFGLHFCISTREQLASVPHYVFCIGRASWRSGNLWEPRELIPVGYGQTRRGYVVTVELCWSRVVAGTLVFSKKPADVLWGLRRSLERIGALPEKLVWDREGAIHAGGGRPTDAFAGFCGQLGVGWVILAAADPQAKGVLERSHHFMRSNFEPGRRFANETDLQLQFDGWCDKTNQRVQRTVRAVPAERLDLKRERMRPLPERLPDLDRRLVTRVPQQPYLRVDRNGERDGGGLRLAARVGVVGRDLVARLAGHEDRLERT